MKPFCYPATLLLPSSDRCHDFSVVACDQYTAEPAYWQAVSDQVSDKTSAYHMVYPEVYLGKEEPATRIAGINHAMQSALDSDFFVRHADSMSLVLRTLASGETRLGLVCAIDLEDYDFSADSHSLIRATEGTVLSRIPPRVTVRSDAPLELPHVMLLFDDPDQTVLAPMQANWDDLVYDFDLMQDSGHLKGRLLTASEQTTLADRLQALYDCAKRTTDHPLLFAVGDGNHSLATAKTCYENLKKTLPADELADHPARFALVELVNLHDDSLQFEPIHRVLFEVNASDLLAQFVATLDAKQGAVDGLQQVEVVLGDQSTTYSIQAPTAELAVGSLQQFLDSYLADHAGEVDYIHGDDVVFSLCKADQTIGFLLPAIQKSALFSSIHADGVLPRKTFSMGHACDKRFYLEGREIRTK